jgi:hypothetical protein
VEKFNQVLNVHGVHGVTQMDIHTAEPLVETAIGKSKMCINKSPATDQILAELIKAGGETLCSEIHRLIRSIWNKVELPQQWKESILYQFIKRVIRLTVVIIEESPSYQLPTKFYPTFYWPG